MIRDGKLSDFTDQLLELFDEAYAETPFNGMKYNRAHVQRWFANACSFDQFFCKVVEEDNAIVGILIGYVTDTVWGISTAQTLVSYSRRDTHKLIRMFVSWSKEKGAAQVTVATVPGKDKYEQLVEKLGFFESGNLYTMEI
jgi:hypothetical protein